MRNVRIRRRSFIDLRRVTLGDWIVLLAALGTLVSLFMPWYRAASPLRNNWAFTYSEVASVLVIVFFLATLFLVLYPALSPDLRLAPLPFSTPLIFFTMATVLILMFTYELGRYGCIVCTGVSGRGFGIWLGLTFAALYLIGAIIRWGSKPARRTA